MEEHPPSEGERSALKGYHNQYKVAASLIYEGLLNRTLREAILVDPEAGRVDDIQILTENRLDAYQVKWGTSSQNFTYTHFREIKKTKTGETPNLINQLADGWKRLRKKNPGKRVVVHLYTNNKPSMHDRMKTLKGTSPSGIKTFQYFLNNIWNPIKEGSQDIIDKLSAEWRAIWDEIINFTKLNNEEFYEFLNDCELDFEQVIPENYDIIEEFSKLYYFLYDQVDKSESKTPAILSRKKLIKELEWEERFTFRSTNYVILEDYYVPIEEKIQEFSNLISLNSGGYLAILGSPGCGKTSFCSYLNAIENTQISKYFMNIEGSGESVTHRAEAINYLHDLILDFERLGFKTENKKMRRNLNSLQREFKRLLEYCREKWIKNHQKTIFIIDGIDHIQRVQPPDVSITTILPNLTDIPEGIFFILSTQTLNSLPSTIEHNLAYNEEKIIQIENLSKSRVFEIIERFPLNISINLEQKELIFQKTNGHPLALIYLLNNINQMEDFNRLTQFLEDHSRFGENVEELYLNHWEPIRNTEAVKFFGIISRLRGFLDFNWILEEFGIDKVTLLKTFLHYFRKEGSRLYFFHNSFREFLQKKSQEFTPDMETSIDIYYHNQILEKIENSNLPEHHHLKYDLIYHYYHAEQYNKIFDLSVPDYFRNQFYGLRPYNQIKDDINLALKALRPPFNHISIFNLILIGAELHQRNEVLNHFYEDIFEILIDQDKIQIVLDNCKDGYVIKVPQSVALNACLSLLAYVKLKAEDLANDRREFIKNQIKILLRIAEPFLLEKEIQNVDNIEKFYNWAKISSLIYDIYNVFDNFEKINFSSEENKEFIETGLIKKIYPFLIKNSTAPNFIEPLEYLENKLDLENYDNLILWFSFQRRLYNFYLKGEDRENCGAILSKIEGKIEFFEDELPVSVFIDLGEIFETIPHREKILELYSEDFLNILNDLSIFRPEDHKQIKKRVVRIINLIKLLTIIEIVDDDDFFDQIEDLSNEDLCIFYFRHAISIVAVMIGKARLGQLYEQDVLNQKLHQILENYKNFQINYHPRYLLHTLPWNIVFYHLIKTCGKYYPDLFDVFKEFFTSEWDRSNLKINWYPSIKREILLAFGKYFAQNDWITSQMIKIEDEMLQNLDLHGRIEQYIIHLSVFREFGDQENVNRLFNLMMLDSFKIGYRKDYQLESVINSLQYLIRQDRDVYFEELTKLASLIPRLGELTEGPAEFWTGLKLLKIASLDFPCEAFQIFNWLLKNESIKFFDGLSKILESSVENIIDLNLLRCMLINYFIPLSQIVPERFLKKYLKRECNQNNEERLLSISKHIISEIRKYALPSIRGDWLRNLIINLTKFGVSIETLNVTSKEIKPKNKFDDTTILEPLLGVPFNLIELLNNIKSFSRFKVMWELKTKENSRFDWRPIIWRLSFLLNDEDFENVSNLVISHSQLGYEIVKIYYYKNNHEKVQEICMQLFEYYKSLDWPPTHWWYPKMYKVLVLLSRLNSNIIDSEIIPFIIKTSLDESYRLYDKIFIIDKIIKIILQRDESLSPTLWSGIKDYINQIFYNIKPFSFNGGPVNLETDHNDCIRSFILKNLVNYFKEIRIRSSKLLLDLKIDEKNYFSSLISNQLTNGNEEKYNLLILLYIISKRNILINNDIIPSLVELFDTPNIFYRYYINKILQNLGQSPLEQANTITETFMTLRDIPAQYTNINPQIDRVINLFFSSILIRISAITRISFIELQSALYKIMHNLNQTLLKEENYAQQKTRHFNKIGLMFIDYKPEFSIVRKAIYKLIALLIDNSILDYRFINIVKHLSFFDLELFKLEALPKPKEIPIPIFEGYSLSHDNFLDNIDGYIDSYHTETINNQVVLGEFTEYQFLYHQNGAEKRRFTTFFYKRENQEQNFLIAYNKKIREKLAVNEDLYEEDLLIIHNRPRFNDIKGQEWICINPKIPLKLGWHLSNEGLFRWKNNEGDIMVETIWWVDGEISMRDVHFCKIGEGWVVLCSKAGYEKLRSLGNIKGKYSIKRFISHTSEESEEITKKYENIYSG